MLETDPQAQAMLKEYNNLPMPNQQLSDTEIRQYLRYFHWFDAQPAGPVTSGAAGHRVGGPDMAPHTPQALGSAPAKPWRSSIPRFVHGL